MVTVELRVVSDRREGLLLALGEVLIANQFKLMRHRRANTDQGVVMVLVVQGEENRLLQLEEQLGTHWMVRSFEANPYDPEAPTQPLSATTTQNVPAPAPATTPADAGTPPETAVSAVDPARAEVLLPQIARDYPQIFGVLMGFERSLEPSQREAMMVYIGTRAGAWVYKRDFALGARLNLSGSIKHIALPAMRQMLPTELDDDVLSTSSSPFCVAARSVVVPQCHFFRGFLEGVLSESGSLGNVRVNETACRATGATACKFVFHV